MKKTSFFRILFAALAAAFLVCGPADAARRRWVPPGSSFNVITDLPWEELWWATTISASDGAQIQWTDTGGTKVLANSTSANRPNYRASVAKFGNKPAVQGNISNTASLAWDRGSNLSAPYTVVVIGSHGVSLTTYSVLAADFSQTMMFPWVSFDTTLYDDAYTDGSSHMAGRYTSNATLWHTSVVSGNTAARFGRNGFPEIGSLTTTQLTGLKLFTYPTSGAFYSEGYVALIGVLPNAAASNTNWKPFLRWVESYYGIKTATRTMIMIDGDSRSDGAGQPSNPATGRPRTAAAGYIGNQYGITWGNLLQSDLTDPVQMVAAGQAGRPMSDQVTDAAAYVDTAKSESVGGKYIDIVINCGSNDIVGGASAATAYASLKTYVTDRHAAGWLVLIGTVPTWTDITGPQETERLALNQLILTNGSSGSQPAVNADGIVDIAGDGISPQSNNQLNPNFHPENFVLEHAPTDHYTHFSAAGHVIVKDLVKTAIALSPFSVN